MRQVCVWACACSGVRSHKTEAPDRGTRPRRKTRAGGQAARPSARRALIISRCVQLNSLALSSSIVAITALSEWLCSTAPAPRSS